LVTEWIVVPSQAFRADCDIILDAIADPEAQADTGFLWHVLSLVSAVVLAPLAEEVFFRGLVQSVLRNYFGSPWVAVALASLLFASVHMDLHWAPALTALGLVLGYSYERTGRLLAPVLIHALFNGVSMVDELIGH
jgi:membrane protease YdiL (CAAX protease family)